MSAKDQITKRLWKALKERLEKHLTLVPWSVALIDRDYRLRWINQNFPRLLGLSGEDLLGRPCYQVIHQRDEPPENCLLQRMLTESPEARCLEEAIKDKRFQVCALPIFEDGELLGALHFLFDLRPLFSLRQDLEEKELILKTLFDAYPDIIVFKDQKLRWKMANKATLKLFGLGAEEWQGKTDLELAENKPSFQEVFSYCYLTDQIALRRGNLSRSLEEVPQEGEIHTYDVVKIPVKKGDHLLGLLVIGHDITALKRSHAKIKEYAARLRALLDGLPLGVIFVSPEGRIYEVNRKFTEIYGYRTEEVIGKKGEFLFPDKESWQDFQKEMIPAIQETGVYEAEVIQRRKDGSLFPLRALGRALENRGRIWIVEDITAQKEAEERTRRLEQRLAQARRLESLAILAGGMAHDFNNLLTIILGRAQLLNEKTKNLSPNIRKDVEIILEACERAKNLVEQMLTFSGQEHPQNPLPTNLNQLLVDLKKVLEDFLRPGVELKLNLDSDLPEVLADPDQLEQLIINLVKNAAEAIGHQLGCITISTEKRSIEHEDLSKAIVGHDLPSGDYVSLKVRDTGPGIPEEKIHHIFDPFFSTKELGRGLGLASVLGIIKAHRGALFVESTPGEGTTFEILLPQAS